MGPEEVTCQDFPCRGWLPQQPKILIVSGSELRDLAESLKSQSSRFRLHSWVVEKSLHNLLASLLMCFCSRCTITQRMSIKLEAILLIYRYSNVLEAFVPQTNVFITRVFTVVTWEGGNQQFEWNMNESKL